MKSRQDAGAPMSGAAEEKLSLLANPRAFCRQYLPDHCTSGFNGMHSESFEEYARQIACAGEGRSRTGRRVAIAAPRGAAKSTVHTLLFPIMDILSRREQHQVIISGTMQQAKNRIASIVRELRTNPAIRDAFFGGETPRFRSTTQCIELNGCRIEAFSAGSEMRGVSHGAWRPTRIILDDVEQSRLAVREKHRAKLVRWYDEVVENLGDSYTHITIVGTILHSDSLLSRLLARHNFNGKLYRSVMSWDNRPDLWREWQRLCTDKSNPEAAGAARRFYEANAAAMLEGTEVLWPDKESYLALQEKLLVLGREAFFKEKQNSPIRDGCQMFDTAQWQKFTMRDGEIVVLSKASGAGQEAEDNRGAIAVSSTRDACAPRDSARQNSGSSMASSADLKYFGFLDPAVGKSNGGEGDYAAIVTVGKAPDGTIYVMDVWMDRASPMKQVEQIFALHDKYRYVKFGFESNGFQSTLATLINDHQNKRRRAGRPGMLPIEKLENRHSKHSRISLLEPHILAGNIIFRQDLRQAFFAQADEYTGIGLSHDDGLDALASCIEMTRRIEKPIRQIVSIRTRTSTRSPL